MRYLRSRYKRFNQQLQPHTKRDVVKQIITLVEENQEVLTEHGFDPRRMS